jgi:thioester reductase-like protein
MPATSVLLSGATGFVGRFLLAQLIEDTDATIHCVVRGQSQQHALSRLRGLLSKWNLWRDGFEQRIVVIPGDMSRPRLGIEADTYEALARSVDSIYHCATSMNHLESYAMAKPTNVNATRELLKLATRHKPKLVNYISTLGVFGSRTETNRIVDESSPIEREKHSTASGYVASKWVGEKIFMIAAERGIPCNIFRVGLVWADTQQGRYDELQQVYRLFKSCLLSGYGIQDYRPLMPPTPVDYVARSIVHLAAQPREENAIFHISSSKQSVDGIFERCNEIGATSLKLLPYYDWIREIERLHHAGQSLPAVPLIEFAFSMDEASFEKRQKNIAAAKTRFDCTRTQRELQKAGIATPSLNDDALKVYVAKMLSTDVDLQGSIIPSTRERSTREQA